MWYLIPGWAWVFFWAISKNCRFSFNHLDNNTVNLKIAFSSFPTIIYPWVITVPTSFQSSWGWCQHKGPQVTGASLRIFLFHSKDPPLFLQYRSRDDLKSPAMSPCKSTLFTKLCVKYVVSMFPVHWLREDLQMKRSVHMGDKFTSLKPW